jgi:UDP-N-acetylmuramoyl-L-alanyl-D-glutamate--2,6-diaminopimelate ligase
MGEVADKLADVVIITDDNPRSEEPKQIRREIIGNRTNFLEIGNRRDAIHYALEHAQSSDFVLIAGRGCEKFQLVGSDKIPFEDYQVALQASKNS